MGDVLKDKNPVPRAMKGPNGLIELQQMNAVQGWHSGYLSPVRARELAARLVALADEMDAT